MREVFAVTLTAAAPIAGCRSRTGYSAPVQCHVGATLDVRRTALRIVDGYAVDRDAHQIQAERILRRDLAREARDVDTFVVVEDRELVVDDLHGDVRSLALDEAGVDDVVRVHIAAALELDLIRTRSSSSCRTRQRFPSRGVRAMRTGRCRRRRRSGTAGQAFVARVADESQADIGLVATSSSPRSELAGSSGPAGPRVAAVDEIRYRESFPTADRRRGLRVRRRHRLGQSCGSLGSSCSGSSYQNSTSTRRFTARPLRGVHSNRAAAFSAAAVALDVGRQASVRPGPPVPRDAPGLSTARHGRRRCVRCDRSAACHRCSRRSFTTTFCLSPRLSRPR